MGASFKLRNPKSKKFEDAASLVYPNPELKGDEEKLASIDIDGITYEIEGGAKLPDNLAYIDGSSEPIQTFSIVKSPFDLAINPDTDEYGYIKKVEGADTFVPFKSGGGEYYRWQEIMPKAVETNYVDSRHTNIYSLPSNEYIDISDDGIFTVKQDITLLSLFFETSNYKTAGGSYSQGELYYNSEQKIIQTATSKIEDEGTVSNNFIIENAKVGDTFYTQTPNSSGYPRQALEIKMLDISIEPFPTLQKCAVDGYNMARKVDADYQPYIQMDEFKDSPYISYDNTVFTFNKAGKYLIYMGTGVGGGSNGNNTEITVYLNNVAVETFYAISNSEPYSSVHRWYTWDVSEGDTFKIYNSVSGWNSIGHILIFKDKIAGDPQMEYTTILDKGQISNLSSYLYPELITDPHKYKYLKCITEVDGIEYITIVESIKTGNFTLNVTGHNGKNTFTVGLTFNKVASVYYSGSWKNVYMSIYGFDYDF